MIIARTNRLILRRFVESDASFILKLMNEPSYHANIGDRGVTTLAAAEDYLRGTLLRSYDKHGFGLYLVALRAADGQETTIGFCGLVNRKGLDGIDLGYALMPSFWGKGFAREAAQAVMRHACEDLGLERLVAIVAKHNHPSAQLLLKLGFTQSGEFRIEPEGEILELFHCDLKKAL